MNKDLWLKFKISGFGGQCVYFAHTFTFCPVKMIQSAESETAVLFLLIILAGSGSARLFHKKKTPRKHFCSAEYHCINHAYSLSIANLHGLKGFLRDWLQKTVLKSCVWEAVCISHEKEYNRSSSDKSWLLEKQRVHWRSKHW